MLWFFLDYTKLLYLVVFIKNLIYQKNFFICRVIIYNTIILIYDTKWRIFTIKSFVHHFELNYVTAFDFTVFRYKWLHFEDIDGQDHFLSRVQVRAYVRTNLIDVDLRESTTVRGCNFSNKCSFTAVMALVCNYNPFRCLSLNYQWVIAPRESFSPSFFFSFKPPILDNLKKSKN